MHILYLHGFNSAGFGGKVDALRQVFGPQSVVNPTLPMQPKAAMDLLLYLTKALNAPDFFVLGSSLGGFYALQLAKQLGVKAVLVNPGIENISQGLSYALGELTNYKTQEVGQFTQADLDALATMECSDQDLKAMQKHVWAYMDQDDEVLPTAKTAKRLQASGIFTKVYPGGNHQFQHMFEMLEDVKAKFGASVI